MLMVTLECHRLNGGKSSHWLRGSRQKGSHDFIPTHSPRLANDICLEPYGSTNRIPSILEGMWGVVDRKAGGLAVARHSPPGH